MTTFWESQPRLFPPHQEIYSQTNSIVETVLNSRFTLIAYLSDNKKDVRFRPGSAPQKVCTAVAKMEMDYLRMIDEVDNVPLDFDFTNFYSLRLPNDSCTHGYIQPEVVGLMPWSPDFNVDHGSKTIQLADSSDGQDPSATCCAAFQKTVDTAIDKDIFPLIHGVHSEPYKIVGATCFVQLERFASALFGICARGAHMTAYTYTSDGELKVWIPRRSKHLFTYPGKLDTTVAGGVKATHTPFRCILEESVEEASLPKDFVERNAKSVGLITYMTQSKRNYGIIHPDLLYVFDLELPADMVPKPNDDEVEEFVLMSVNEIKKAMVEGEFKSNCNLVMIDFFVRHGIINAEEEVDYVVICSRLHRQLPFPTSSRR